MREKKDERDVRSKKKGGERKTERNEKQKKWRQTDRNTNG